MFLNYAFYVLFSVPISNFLKKLIARPRPKNPEEGAPNRRYFNLRGHENNCSLPSGDTLQSAIFIGFCAYNLPNFYNFMGGTSFGFKHIVLVASARVFYHCHYIGDTIAGCAVGLFLSYIYYNFETHLICDSIVSQFISANII